MKFAEMLGMLNQDKRMRRSSWPTGTWVCLMSALIIPAAMVNSRTQKFTGDHDLDSQPYMAMMKNGKWQPGWTPDQEDFFSEDWEDVAPETSSGSTGVSGVTPEEEARARKETAMEEIRRRIDEMMSASMITALTPDQEKDLDTLRAALEVLRS